MANIKGYGRANVFRDNANWEVMRTNHFELLVNSLDQGPGGKVGNGEDVNDIWLGPNNEYRDALKYPNAEDERAKNLGADTAEDAFRIAVQKAFIPQNSLDTATIKHGNETVNVATSYSVEGGSITCKDAVVANIERLCWAWFNQVINVETMLMGLVVDYKKTTQLVLFSPDGSVARFWTCLGTFPKSFSSSEPSYDSSELREISMDLVVDLAIPGVYSSNSEELNYAYRLNYVSPIRGA